MSSTNVHPGLLERPKPAPKGDSQDTVVLHCAVCGESSASLAVNMLGDFSPRNVWLRTKEQAEQIGWRLNTTATTEPITRDGEIIDAIVTGRTAEWLCPICAAAEKNAPQYPTFSGRAVACPKCGGQGVRMTYERAPREHLRRNCPQCQFAWNEQTKDGRITLWTRTKKLWERLGLSRSTHTS